MSKHRQLAFSIAAGAGLLWIASVAVAQPMEMEIVVTGKALPKGHEAVKTNVSIQDIDLSTPSGAKEMERRVAKAVDFVCQTHAAYAKEEQREAKACTDFAWASARPQMDRAVQSAKPH